MKQFGTRASDILWMRYNAPKDGGDGTSSDAGTTENKDGGTATSDVKTPPTAASPPSSGEKMLPQSEVNRIVTERLEQEKERTKTKKLKDDQKFEELSKTQEGQIAALTTKIEEHTTIAKTLQEELDAYKTLVADMVKTQRKGIPDHFNAVLDKLSPLDLAKWLADNADKLTAPPSNSGGPPPSPKPQGQQSGNLLENYISSRNKVPEGKK